MILIQGKREEEDQGLDVAEFISAMAAGNNARLMVVACAGAVDSTTLALVAAAHQTGGRVICILPGLDQLRLSKQAFGHDASRVEFVVGEAQNLLSTDYLEADFVLIDCHLGNHEDIFRAMLAGRKRNGSIVVGYNAFSGGSWQWSGMRVQLLPIGGGLLVSRISASDKVKNGNSECGKSNWVVKLDKCTGEEHVFRVRSPHGNR